jgi:flagellar capping protein FliD
MADFSIMGMASGLPADIVDQLMATEQTRLTSMENDQDYFEYQLTVFDELDSMLLSFSSSAQTLQETSSWSPHTSSSSDEDILQVAADLPLLFSAPVFSLCPYSPKAVDSGPVIPA